MTGIGDNSAVFHNLEVFFADNADVAGQGAEEITDSGSLTHRHHGESVHHGLERRQRIHLGDNHIGAHSPHPRGQTATAPAITTHHKISSGNQTVGCANDAVDGALAGSVTLVKKVLGLGIIDGNDRVL